MSPRRRDRRKEKPADARSSPSLSGANLLQRVTLGVVTALYVAAPLVPGESIERTPVGVVLAMLWLVVLLLWLLERLLARRTEIVAGPVTLAAGVLLAWHTLSAVLVLDDGNGRAAVNSLWQWIGLGVGFFMLRQTVRTAVEARALCAVMIGLAVCLSAYAVYQYAVELPQARDFFERNPEAALREAGLTAPPGSVQRKLYAARLASSEPFATFSLTNSLAGFLAPWLIAAMGVAAVSRKNRTAFWTAVLAVALIAIVLLMTQSRTALAAVVCGAVLLAGALRCCWLQGRRFWWSLVAGAGLLAAGLALLAVFRPEFVSAAMKSVSFRLQYWQATLALIADHPLLGCGPGQFQNVYQQYKLPQASETVADPHNFLLEIWATAGTPALLAAVAVAGLFTWRIVKCRRASADNEVDRTESSRTTPWHVFIGAVGGVILACLVGWVFQSVPARFVSVAGVPLGALVVLGLSPWVRHARLPVGVIGAAAAALAVNLLAAGGIGYSGVADSLWLLLALGLCLGDFVGGKDPRPAARPFFVLLIVGVAAALIACYRTGYHPVLRGRSLIRAAMSSYAVGQFDRAESQLLAATQADPLTAGSWRLLADLQVRKIAAARGNSGVQAELLPEFQRRQQRAVALDPQSSVNLQLAGLRRYRLYRATGDAAHLLEAAERYRRAIELAPTDAMAHAELARVLELAGRHEQAEAAAREALRLDELMPHEEQQLDNRWLRDDPLDGPTARRRMATIIAP